VFAALLAFVLTAQVPPVDPAVIQADKAARELKIMLQRAAQDARQWALHRMIERYPVEHGLKLKTTKAKLAYFKQRSACYNAFREGAYRRICRELDVTPEELMKAVGKTSDTVYAEGDPRGRERPRGQQPVGRFDVVGKHRSQEWFVAEMVRLSDRDAKLYRWTNPPEEKPRSKDARAVATEGMLPPEK
jgi:hypothetical protein